MNIGKSSAKSTLIQVVIFLIAFALLILYKKDTIVGMYASGEISKIGMIINGIIFALFFVGMLRIVLVLFRYINEQRVLFQLTEYLKENAQDPTARLQQNSLAVNRYKAIRWLAKQGSPINQEALASSSNAHENSRLTLIRFVHSTLILAGVFGTVVSLSMALIGAAGLLNSPEGVKEMGAIISGMSSALSSTITAIVCFFVFAYFYLRLNDARIQLLTQIEDMTSMYLIPSVSHTQEGMINKVAELTNALNKAAEKLLMVEDRFMLAGDRLQLAVNDLHGQVKGSSLDDIKDLIRKGFHLSEPEYDSDKSTDLNKPAVELAKQAESDIKVADLK
ncbi:MULTISPECIES: MotA/TolQ/ExbB proton channel family protein [Cocleimonas]|nr:MULTISPECIES: MotA/TolQ/ExbB proton channel family protein [Cocleimonas]MEB8434121.1 MotA/TolQ/ExbB proton channel family protein [Cocleimonas sp. KMM 6892]MEC4717019.1 MotA/TolQ/ExbB proton channel family protein [Cocleimonas sp. KMM 6895]MEC4746393.1 MotA/TolQ/ExbB proton channel family protein [Cocleimonas sp. KMM 6896]